MRKTVPLSAAAMRCAGGVLCVSYDTLGEPAKLSRGNPGPWCFACEKRSGDSKVEAVAARPKVTAAKHRKAKKRNRSKDKSRMFVTERSASPSDRPPTEPVQRTSVTGMRRR